MALLINRPIAEGFPEHEFYVRVHCAAAVKTRLAPRPNPQAMADEAYAAKLAAGLTPEDIANRPAEYDGQPTRWTSDAERLKDAAAVAADRARRAGEEAVRSAGERDVRSSARIEFYRSRADADAGRMPFDVTFAAFDLDLSDGAPNPLAQAYAAAKRRYPMAKDETAPQPEAPLLLAPDARLAYYGPVGTDEEAEAALTTDDLLGATDDAVADVVAKLTHQRRKRFTELLNVELAELEQSRGGPKEDRKREARIQRLLGVFARVGEM